MQENTNLSIPQFQKLYMPDEPVSTIRYNMKQKEALLLEKKIISIKKTIKAHKTTVLQPENLKSELYNEHK